MKRPLAAALAAVALSGILAGPALAAKPVVEVRENSGAFDIDCGAFSLTETFSETVRISTWLGADGSPLREQAHVSFDGTITGPGDSLTLSDPGHLIGFFDYDSETLRQIGLIYGIAVPGYGMVALDAGSITFLPDGSVEIQGPHQVWDSGLEALICPLFE